MGEKIDPKNHGQDFFSITLTGLTSTDLLDHQYAAIRMANISAESSDNRYEFFRDLAENFQTEETGTEEKLNEINSTVTLTGPEALYLHHAHIHIMHEAKEAGQDRTYQNYRQYAYDVQQEIERAGGLPAIELLQNKIQDIA